MYPQVRLELDKRTSVVKLDLICPSVKIGYRLIDGEFNSVKCTILVDFGFVFVARIRTRQLINLGEDSFSFHVLCNVKRGGFS